MPVASLNDFWKKNSYGSADGIKININLSYLFKCLRFFYVLSGSKTDKYKTHGLIVNMIIKKRVCNFDNKWTLDFTYK